MTKKEWRKSEERELNEFREMKIYQVEKTPPNTKLILTRWVPTYKEDNLKGASYKSRLVIQGCVQEENIHFDKYRVLCQVIDLLSIRLLTVIASQNKYIIHHLDIALAYLNASLPRGERIYVKPPLGYPEAEGYSWLLLKSVYCMKQAGYEWFECLKEKLTHLGFEQSEVNGAMFTRTNKVGYLTMALYVNDLFLMANNEGVLAQFKTELEKIFDLKCFGEICEYLGIEFKRTKEGYSLSQKKCIDNLVNEFEQHGIKTRETPIVTNYEGYGSRNNAKEDHFFETTKDESSLLTGAAKTKYISGVGSLTWITNNTRPILRLR